MKLSRTPEFVFFLKFLCSKSRTAENTRRRYPLGSKDAFSDQETFEKSRQRTSSEKKKTRKKLQEAAGFGEKKVFSTIIKKTPIKPKNQKTHPQGPEKCSS